MGEILKYVICEVEEFTIYAKRKDIHIKLWIISLKIQMENKLVEHVLQIKCIANTCKGGKGKGSLTKGKEWHKDPAQWLCKHTTIHKQRCTS